MLCYEVAKELYEEIKEKAARSSDAEFKDFYQSFLRDAVRYAETRASWAFMEWSERCEDGKDRSIKHDGYMSRLSAICRNLGIEGIDEIMPERKTKGDFACYIALFLALEQR